MRTKIRLRHIWLLLALTMLATQIAQAGGDRYPVFVDCPDDIVTGNHCDSVFYQVRAEVPGQDHPNNRNIRYHLISGPGEIDEFTGWWHWYADTATIALWYTVEIAASIGNSPEHMTSQDSRCRFMVGAIDNEATILMDGQPKNSVFFITAPGVYRYDISVQDIDECDTPLIEIAKIDPEPAGQLLLEGDQLVFEAAAADADKKFIIRFIDRNAVYDVEQWFVLDTRDSVIPYFNFCPEDLCITKCDQTTKYVGVADPDRYHNIGISLEVISGPGHIEGNRFWTFQPTGDDVDQTLEVEIAARYGDVVTAGDENCHFEVTVEDRPAGISPVNYDCGAMIMAPVAVETSVGLLSYDHDCTPLSLSIAGVSPSFIGEMYIDSKYGGGRGNAGLIVRPSSSDVGQTFQITIHGSGASDWWTCELSLAVIELLPYRVKIDLERNVIQGEYQKVDVVLEEGTVPFGSFNFLLRFNTEAIFPVGVFSGEKLYSDSGCGWEYFNSLLSFGPDSSHREGFIHIRGEADRPDDLYPTCFLPETYPATLFTIDFRVTNDRTFECDSVPIEFYWRNCTSNSFGSVLGIDDFVSADVFDETGQLIPPVGTFPNISGATEDCNRTDQHRLIDFQHGGIHIICADSIDPRVSIGDINLNHVPYEVADAILFTNYFVYGDGVFIVNPEMQAAASDVNGDGELLTIEDLQWLIRVITENLGWTDPYDSTSPNPAIFRQEADGSAEVLTPDTLGAAWLVFGGNVTPMLAANGMEMRYAYDGSTTRVLIYSLDGHSFPAGLLLSNVTAPLLGVQTCTYNGAKVEAIIDQALSVDGEDEDDLPESFALAQNFPNPFNSQTLIQFDLPHASEVTFSVYNILGKIVYQRTQYYPGGRHELVWDGCSMSGRDAATGIYFYRLKAGTFTSTKKMILLR